MLGVQQDDDCSARVTDASSLMYRLVYPLGEQGARRRPARIQLNVGDVHVSVLSGGDETHDFLSPVHRGGPVLSWPTNETAGARIL